MIQFTGYDLLWLFFIYSFAGWVLETAAATFMHRKFSNRGLVNGPLCILYGVGAVAMSVGLQELTGLWLFLFASLYAAVTEFVAGKLIERFYHKRWWDYSKSKWNLDGYICLPVSLIKGALGYVVVKYANRWVFRLLAILPQLLVHIVLLVLIGVLVVDVLASYLLVTGKSRHPEKWLEANNKIDRFRIAKGCDFYKIVMLFFVGAFLGDITETIFCRITAGVWMSRSSVVWGPFSIVWGLAIAMVTAMLYKYKDRSDGFLFWTGTFLGGAVVWFKILYPKISGLIEKIPIVIGKTVTWMLIIFMCCNVVVSCMALIRYDERGRQVEATQNWQVYMDEHYDDAKMARIYPNAKTK